MGTSIVAFVVVLGVLIFFHELGHFLVARWFGVGVERFSLGFGPRIIGKTVGITDYRISAVPLGGYVKMVGEEPGADIDPADIPLSFTHKHVIKRILIVGAGPFFNLLLAVLIFFSLFAFAGTFILQPTIGEVQTESPAAAAGLQPGDRVTAIDGRRIDSWEQMAEIIAGSNGRELNLSVSRDGETLQTPIVPRRSVVTNFFGEEVERFTIGVTSAGDVVAQELNFFEAAAESIVQTYNIAELTVVSIVKLIQGSISVKTLGGPIMIAEMAGQQAEAGVSSLLFFIALISINLAILNFLPIPILDGGHLLFFFIELLIGRPVNLKVREVAQQIGVVILLMLMIFVFYNDITRIFFS